MTTKAQETASRKPSPAQSPGSQPRGGRTERATRLGLTGPSGARRRGSLLRRMLATGDWLTMVATLCAVTAASPDTDVGTLFWATMFSPIWILVLKLHGLYDNDHRRIRHSTLDEISSLISAAALGTLALDGLLALSPVGPLPAASAIAVVARRVATHPETRLHLVGYLTPRGEDAASAMGGLPRLGSIADISRVARDHEVERVIVTEQEMSEAAAERLIEQCKAAGLALTFLPQHFGLLGPGIELNRLAELPVLDFRFSDPPRSTEALKRVMDVTISGFLLLLFSPVFLVSSLLILLDSGRPVLFRQRRAGKDGKPFTVLKFRTMVPGAEEQLGELVDLEKLKEPAFKIADDPRVTRAGRMLRRFSLDELPQFVNVLRGDMSLVGPRPEEEAVVALYDERQRIRLAVKPGMTGPMQVYGRADLTFEERLAMERDYLDNISVAGDLAILLRTPAAIVRGEGSH
jgi:exopolysaccharide biosynthesis polyprenyl glycosylphosphotransferase